MRIDVLTVFPEMIRHALGISIVGRAREQGLLTAEAVDLRAFAFDRHRTTDDAPYGGGPGMVMRPEPVFAAVDSVVAGSSQIASEGRDIILLTPQGQVFNQRLAAELAVREHLILICGRYEGFDERIRDHLPTRELSIGDYVLTGGELPALVVIDAVARLIPGVLGSDESAEDDSHTSGVLEYPHYTRPPVFRDWPVPDVLLSGNHALIRRWRRERSLERTLARRPDLLDSCPLTEDDRVFLVSIGATRFAPAKPATRERSRRAARAP
ncbi:MAG: tRNA (guanosine(37)-N1)-methyltransferase TrmD [Chloroflexota bacterium]|nr:MAG: tRNA (guanosine(37)-N1)-methyltransferase TrmD [Chloroflexota bacterium]